MPIYKFKVEVMAKTPKGKEFHGVDPFIGTMWTATCPEDMQSMALLQVVYGPQIDFSLPQEWLNLHKKSHKIIANKPEDRNSNEMLRIIGRIKEIETASAMANVLYAIRRV